MPLNYNAPKMNAKTKYPGNLLGSHLLYLGKYACPELHAKHMCLTIGSVTIWNIHTKSHEIQTYIAQSFRTIR